MILVIDTSAPTAGVALVDANKVTEAYTPTRAELIPVLRRIALTHAITKVAVITGPGSFTGLRAGVSFGLGLAKGLGVPIVPLPTLDLQAARSDSPVTAVVEAGRGRFFYLVPGGPVALGEPLDIPRDHELVGSAADGQAFIAAGHRFKPDGELRSLGEAAVKMLETAREVPYRNLKIEYMQSFSASRNK
jgi:tRNA threonylcarbamoyl adenosine modification protein YeaZ